MKITECKVGMKVRFIDENSHKREPEFYPAIGTIGRIKSVEKHTIKVEWPERTTSENGIWYCFPGWVEPINESYDNITNNEIYQMLKPKLKKNEIIKESRYNVVEAVALAYRCGYIRGQKGRPFKYNDKVTD